MRLARTAILALPLVTLPANARGQDSYEDVPRIVAVGDVHGDYGQFTTVLREAKVVDDKLHWIGGRTHLVQTGDIPDRGPDSRKVMELLMALAPEALKAGGRVHPLIGNHEAMNVFGDLRYVDPGEYAAFRGKDSEKLQRRAFMVLSDSTRRNDTAYRDEWYAQHPLGWFEQRLAFEGNGRYASWIREHNAVLRINGFLFLHGGIAPKYVDSTLAALNGAVRAALAPNVTPQDGNIAEDPEGPLWYRGLAQGSEDSLKGHVEQVLAKYGVQHVVIGHTVTPGAIFPRFGGKVIMIDVGLSKSYGGPAAALIIEGDRISALHRGTLLDFPTGATDPLDYLEKASALDPPDSRLRKWISQYVPAK